MNKIKNCDYHLKKNVVFSKYANGKLYKYRKNDFKKRVSSGT